MTQEPSEPDPTPTPGRRPGRRTPTRLLVVMPSWVGDAVMATPALDRLRAALPGALIGALCRPGIDAIIAGGGFFDEVHTEPRSGVMGPKRAAQKVRQRRYDSALLLTNSFSTALTARLAGIPRRVGYDRDGRGVLLTHRLTTPRDAQDPARYAMVPAVNFYWWAAGALLAAFGPADTTPDAADGPPARWPPESWTPKRQRMPLVLPPDARLRLGVTADEQAAADAALTKADAANQRSAILNPGGNNPAKRWPTDRFATVARHLQQRHGLRVLLNGSPAERDLLNAIAADAPGCVPLPDLGMTLGALKPLCARAALMVTNDTGPRHIAAAMGTPVVSLFGPTDARWTTIPVAPLPNGDPSEAIITAGELDPRERANDHPDECRIEAINTDRIIAACDALLGA